jgi:CRP-like cAMP-binding protein
MTLKNTPIVQRYGNGDVIISEGIISNNAYIVISGKVQVTKKLEKKTIFINTLKEGDVFGEMGLISNAVRSANVVALGDVTIGIIDKETFEHLVKDLPDDLQAIIRALAERLRFTSEQLSKIGVQFEKTRKALQSYTIKEG